MRIAVLVKQVPKFDAMELGPGGRLVREGLELELNPYCRRAVSKGAELAADTGGTSTAFTLGPPSAEDALREAVAWGVDAGVLIASDLGAGPWGEDGSGTYVGEVRVLEIERERRILSGPIDAQVDEAVRLLVERGALTDSRGEQDRRLVPIASRMEGPGVAVVV